MHTNLISRLKNHPLVVTLLNLKGNSRACVYTEPLFGIPYGLVTPFATLYMFSIGLSDVKIGTIISVGLFFQVIASFIGGTVTDIYGRRKITLVIDLLSWALPSLMWAFAQGFWWFIAASTLNALNLITYISWNCLLIEDSNRDDLAGIYSCIHIVTIASVFFAPIGGLLVGWLSVVSAVRIMYFLFFLMMTIKAIILYVFSTETKRGVQRMAECSKQPITAILRESIGVTAMIFKTPRTLVTLVVMVTLNIAGTISSSFYSLLLTQTLNMPPSLLAYFPIIRTVCILIFMFAFQNALERAGQRLPMLVGIIIYGLSQFFLVFAGHGGMAAIMGYVISEAFAYAIIMPRRDTLVAANISDSERARISGIMNAVMLCASIPFGYLAGLLSSVNRVFPFVLNIFIYILMFLLVLFSKELFYSKAE